MWLSEFPSMATTGPVIYGTVIDIGAIFPWCSLGLPVIEVLPGDWGWPDTVRESATMFAAGDLAVKLS